MDTEGSPNDEVAAVEAPITVPPVAAPLSFFEHLMVPIITLYVGKSRIEFHAHEDTLCHLDFFKTAINASTDKTISLPDEDPAILSALIEYLYKNDYTYDNKTNTFHPACLPPSAEGEEAERSETLTEALFHVEVVLASKRYCCEELKKRSVAHLETLQTKLSDLDTLRYWEVAYNTEAVVVARAEGSEWSDFGEWVGRLFKNHAARLKKTLSEHPKLAHDMLLVVTAPKR